MSKKADKNNTNETPSSYKEIIEFYFFLEMSVDCLSTVESYGISEPIFVNKYAKKRLNDYFVDEG